MSDPNLYRVLCRSCGAYLTASNEDEECPDRLALPDTPEPGHDFTEMELVPMSAPDRVTREREREALEHLRTQTEFWADQQGEGYVKINAGMAKRLIAALSTPQAGGEPEDADPETVRRLVADSCKCDPYSPRHMRPVFVNPSCPWHGDRPAPQVAGPEPRGWLWFGNPGGPAVAVVLLGEAGWEGKRDALCSTEGHAGVSFYVATPPVAGSRETARYVYCGSCGEVSHQAEEVVDDECPRCGKRYCLSASFAESEAWMASPYAPAALARLRAPAPGTGEASEDGEAVWIGYRCNDCFQPWTDDHVRHGEREPVELVLRAPGTGGEEAWEHPLDKELPEHVRPAWAVVREAAGESPLFSGTVSSALGVLRKALRAPSEGTREPGEEGVGIPLPGETMWDAGYAQCMHDFEIPGPDGSIPESRLPAPPIQGETDG